MGFKCGIVGLPNVGKSTIFNALTSAGVPAENFPFCTKDPNIGVVSVSDARLKKLAEVYQPQKTTPTVMQFVDIAGLVKGASQGEGLGNQFLQHIRETDAIMHVVRCFENPDITHVEGTVDPVRDAGLIITELILKDLESLEKRLDKDQKLAKANDKEAKFRVPVEERIMAAFNDDKMALTVDMTKEERAVVQDLCLLTLKPMFFCANVLESEVNSPGAHVANLRALAEKLKMEVVVISGQIESEIAELPEGEKDEFLKALGLEESGLDRIIKKGYAMLGLQTFFTAGEKECRAWTMPAHAKAPQAAGVIHTDFERGFIRAETLAYADFLTCGTWNAAKDKGLVRTEGKEYVVQDGDIMFFLFNV